MLTAGDDTDDRGFSLIDLMVSMSLMAVFMAIFTTGIVQMYRTAGRAEATQAVQGNLDVAFERLDDEVRYAKAISKPDTDGHWVEYLTVDGAAQTCTGLRLQGGLLQRRTWASGATPGSTWNTLASGVSGTFTAGSRADQRQQLTVQLSARFTADDAARETSFQFTALNSDATASKTNDTVCAEGRNQ
ncbi:hypothetical protein GCM10010168_58670 [Actinoplanes ianthinogenes]|uniref:Prepilin-type N-terminal cleavage/methylation domain-containing protein n=1 Tax=Actinoplanes ianthinogenes TaxID=122358 RepID=A0ABM7M281_9ACTN|nr:type II secretion system protein [Actinoplanes ianthinogenes]BCJ45713.1 hypothetical protein Aiant_63700 [Actinoplanes ianthinogenes]GGR32490.1 hypothetical protein GCM10010168_58670 [Actinoplanes ianthinogenes]